MSICAEEFSRREVHDLSPEEYYELSLNSLGKIDWDHFLKGFSTRGGTVVPGTEKREKPLHHSFGSDTGLYLP